MNRTESVVLCRYVKALCPNQHFDEYTPEAWHDILGEFSLADCKAAASTIVKQQAYVAPTDVWKLVRDVRAERIATTPLPDPPAGIGDDEVAYRRWLGQARKAIADGETPEAVALPRRDMHVIEGAFQEAPPA